MSLSFSPATFPTEPSNDGVVAIFWDYESYPSPHTPSIAEAVKAIQMVALDSGSVNSFNLYVDLDRHSKDAGKAASIRQQLHEAGVSVVDCPSNASKTVADKMIIVDLFAFALRSRPPGTVVVISADQDLAYTLSLLRQRRFSVTLISSDAALLGSTTTTSGGQADARFVWNHSPTGQILSPVGRNYGPRIVNSAPSPTPHAASSPPTEPAVQTLSVQPPLPGSPSIAQVVPISQSYPGPSSPSVPVANRSASSPAATGSSKHFTPASVPQHLHDLVTVLLKAVRPEGWPEVEIWDRLRHLNETKWTNKGVLSTHLAEGVTLGILVQSTALSHRNKKRYTYYAIEKGLKKNWR